MTGTSVVIEDRIEALETLTRLVEGVLKAYTVCDDRQAALLRHMITDEKKWILAELERLQRERPKDAEHQRRRLVNRLARLEDPYGKYETHGNERVGRHEHKTDCPDYDSMDDESCP